MNKLSLYCNKFELCNPCRDHNRNNAALDQHSLNTFIDSLDVNEEIKDQLRKITPFNYTGRY